MCFVYFGSGDLVSVTDGVDSKCKAFFCSTPNKGGEQSSKDIEYKYRPPRGLKRQLLETTGISSCTLQHETTFHRHKGTRQVFSSRLLTPLKGFSVWYSKQTFGGISLQGDSRRRSFLLQQSGDVYVPADGLPIKATGEQVAGGVVFTPSGAAHHAPVTLNHKTEDAAAVRVTFLLWRGSWASLFLSSKQKISRGCTFHFYFCGLNS